MVHGHTVNDGETELNNNVKPPKYDVDVKESTITLNLGSVDHFMNEVKEGGEAYLNKDSNETVTETMSFTDVLAAIFGHEIHHTTDKNASLNANNKNFEGPAYDVSDQILKEAKENQNKRPQNK